MQTTNIQSVKTDERIQNISQNEKNEEERSNAETRSKVYLSFFIHLIFKKFFA